ncbi:MAG: DNA-binding protein WhiA [Gaiellales bacterium]|nr:DNA-binding protein WhiA [Gaiellales bacterium]
MSGRASFTRQVREELARPSRSRACCAQAEVAALVRCSGTFHIRGGSEGHERYGVQVTTSVQPAARLVYSFFKSMGAEAQLVVRREPRFQRRLLYEVHLWGSIKNLQMLNELGVISDSFRLEPGIPRRFVRRPCCRAAFLRGCLIGGASINQPHSDAHLEFLTPHEEFARDLAALLDQLGYRSGVYVRQGSHVVYLKGRDSVAGVLAQAGAHEAAVAMEEGAVLKEVRAQANRLANCDQANVRRASTAAQAQLDAIDFLERIGLLRGLPPALQEAAELRRLFPYLGLAELAREGQGALGKSGMNHRLRRLVKTARQAGFDPRAIELGRPRRSPERRRGT